MIERFSQRLFKPVDALPLNLFRVIFALALLLQFYVYTSAHFIEAGILAPKFLFTYDYLPFIHPLPPAGMKFSLYLMFIGPVLMIFRKTMRVGIIVFILSFSYLFLLEESYYNNHFYFFIMLCACWFFFKPKRDDTGTEVIPYWQLFLFQFLVVLVYFYGGLVKLNHDWLILQQPARTLLTLNAPNSWLSSDLAVYYITFGGLIFDLIIGFLLWNRKTFLLGTILAILFHLTNHFMFNMGDGGTIGIFPLAMSAACLLFAPPEGLRKLLARISLDDLGRNLSQAKKQASNEILFPFKPWIRNLLFAFVIIQLILPYRYLLVSKEVDWNGQANFFSWRMKVHTKEVDVKFYARKLPTDKPEQVNIGRIINTMQIKMMGQNADMIYKFSQYLKKELRKTWGTDPIITADIQVGFNGRQQQAFVDPNRDLAQITYSPWKVPDWVLPLQE
ncbi:MAG TPA: HTTM domain-containing protein [Flavobacteriales bacterium]|nr:HTTM domain-containing protein [Flavobacteriales bacterium]